MEDLKTKPVLREQLHVHITRYNICTYNKHSQMRANSRLEFVEIGKKGNYRIDTTKLRTMHIRPNIRQDKLAQDVLAGMSAL